MRYTPRHYAEVLYDLTEENPSAVKPFADFLKKKRVLKLLPKIEKNFNKIWYERKGLTHISIEAANESRAEEAIKKLGSSFRTKKKINDELVGGVRITTGSRRIDSSVKNRLEII